MFSSRELNLLVLEYLDGELLEGTDGELAEGIHFQEGELLKLLHDQALRLDEEYEFRATAKTISWLDRQHRIDPRTEREVRCRLAEYRPHPVEVVPTHGDWQPRNWVSDWETIKDIVGHSTKKMSQAYRTKVDMKRLSGALEQMSRMLEAPADVA